MPLPIGARFGSCEILELIGKGGMGEVYRARDTSLKREVALKVLPADVVEDPERLRRFQREAEILASLNHPGIAAIYGLAENALVMELVEGETLPCPVSVDTAIAYARQIVNAIEYAHDRGIIHRDLKPANIKVTAEGGVKVLDFGLARALDERSPAPTNPADSPTLSMGATAAGMILGTAAYMSPEQAVGKSADRRADIFSFGAVLYEMLTGQRAFHGESSGDTLAAVVKEAPDWAALPAGTPLHLRRLLERTLEKDRRQRLQSIGEARIILERGETETAAPADRRAGWLWPVAAIVMGVAAATLALFHFREVAPEKRVVSSTLLPPDGAGFDFASYTALPALSPDGTFIVFGAKRKDQKAELWVRRLDSPAAQRLVGTDGASFPFWSTDSRWIGFGQDRKLKKIDIQGGPPVTIADMPGSLAGASWSQRGVIVFGITDVSRILKVSESGGPLAPATADEPAENGYFHLYPWFLPDGRHFLYSSGSRQSTDWRVRVGSLDDPGKPGKVVVDARYAIYAQGNLLYLRERALMAQPFDLNRLERRGNFVSLLASMSPSSVAEFTSSVGGILAYRQALDIQSRLAWKDRQGKALASLGEPNSGIKQLVLAPDGKHVAVAIHDEAREDIWIYDAVRGNPIRFTFNSAFFPVWSPDGGTLYFASQRRGSRSLFRQASNGAGSAELLSGDSINYLPIGISPDGKALLLKRDIAGTDRTDFWQLPLSQNGSREKPEPVALLHTSFDLNAGQISPDGHWLAYDSNESGKYEIYTAPMSGSGGKRQISSGGGARSPRWRRDGKELFYVTYDGQLMAVEVATRNGALESGGAQKLFAGGRFGYDVSADGQRFLVIEDDDAAASHPLTLLQNWPALLKK